MNKKLLIGFITAAVAVVLTIVIVILVATGVFTFNNDSVTTSSDITTVDGEGVIEKGILEFGSANAKSGDTVTIPVKLKENPGIWGVQLSIVYDVDNLAVSTCTNGEILDDFNYNDDQNGRLKLVIINSDNENIDDNGLLCNIVFTVVGGASVGDYELAVTNDSLACAITKGNDGNFTEIVVKPEIVTGKITVS